MTFKRPAEGDKVQTWYGRAANVLAYEPHPRGQRLTNGTYAATVLVCIHTTTSDGEPLDVEAWMNPEDLAWLDWSGS